MDNTGKDNSNGLPSVYELLRRLNNAGARCAVLDSPHPLRLGEEGFDCMAELDLDDPSGLAKAESFLLSRGRDFVFAPMALPSAIEQWGTFKVSSCEPPNVIVARWARAWDVRDSRIVRRVDFLFKVIPPHLDPPADPRPQAAEPRPPGV